MPQVQVGLTAGWLTQEAMLPRAPLPGSEPYAPGSFDQHLEQAQKLATAPADRLEPRSDRVPSGPSKGPAQEDGRQSTDDDPAAESGPSESVSRQALADGSEAPASSDEQQSRDNPHDSDDDLDPASDDDAAWAAAAQAHSHRAQEASSHVGNAKATKLITPGRTDENVNPAPDVAKRRAGAERKLHADAASGKAQPQETAVQSEIDVQNAAKGDGEAVLADSVKKAEPNDSSGENQGEPAEIAGVDQVLTESTEVIVSSAASAEEPAVAAPIKPTEEARIEPAEAADQAAAPVAAELSKRLVEDSPPESGVRGTEARPSTHAVNEARAAQQEPQAETVEETVPAEVAERPADYGTDRDELPTADNKREVPAGDNPGGSSTDAKTAEPTVPRSASAQASDAAGRRNEEAASTDASDRARFVQRVARAFESAADRDGHVRLRLYPPELGSLRLELTVRNGLMSARLETETESARNLLLESLPALKERLAGHQIQVERFDIEWRGQMQGGLPQRSGEQDRWQPPSPGRAPRMPGVASAGPGQNEIAARRLNAGTSFDVVI